MRIFVATVFCALYVVSVNSKRCGVFRNGCKSGYRCRANKCYKKCDEGYNQPNKKVGDRGNCFCGREGYSENDGAVFCYVRLTGYCHIPADKCFATKLAYTAAKGGLSLKDSCLGRCTIDEECKAGLCVDKHALQEFNQLTHDIAYNVMEFSDEHTADLRAELEFWARGKAAQYSSMDLGAFVRVIPKVDVNNLLESSMIKTPKATWCVYIWPVRVCFTQGRVQKHVAFYQGVIKTMVEVVKEFAKKEEERDFGPVVLEALGRMASFANGAYTICGVATAYVAGIDACITVKANDMEDHVVNLVNSLKSGKKSKIKTRGKEFLLSLFERNSGAGEDYIVEVDTTAWASVKMVSAKVSGNLKLDAGEIKKMAKDAMWDEIKKLAETSPPPEDVENFVLAYIPAITNRAIALAEELGNTGMDKADEKSYAAAEAAIGAYVESKPFFDKMDSDNYEENQQRNLEEEEEEEEDENDDFHEAMELVDEANTIMEKIAHAASRSVKSVYGDACAEVSLWGFIIGGCYWGKVYPDAKDQDKTSKLDIIHSQTYETVYEVSEIMERLEDKLNRIIDGEVNLGGSYAGGASEKIKEIVSDLTKAIQTVLGADYEKEKSDDGSKESVKGGKALILGYGADNAGKIWLELWAQNRPSKGKITMAITKAIYRAINKKLEFDTQRVMREIFEGLLDLYFEGSQKLSKVSVCVEVELELYGTNGCYEQPFDRNNLENFNLKEFASAFFVSAANYDDAKQEFKAAHNSRNVDEEDKEFY